MAPSYKDDDDQERQFEFDWEREGLPDYLKPFLADESGGVTPNPAPSGTTFGAPAGFGATNTPNDLPDWLSAPPAGPAPPPPGAPRAGTAGSGASNWGSPPAPTGGASNLDAEGLPDWLRSETPSAPGPTPAGSSLGNREQEGLPSWLQDGTGSTGSAPPAPAPFNFGNMDQEGLPSWLQPSTPPPPTTAPQGGPGAVQPFDFGAPVAGDAGSVQPFDFDNIQPFDFGAPPPAGGGLGNIQPFDFGAPPPAGGGLGNVQPFDFGAPAAPEPAVPGGFSMDQEGLPDWLQAGAAPAPPPPAGGLGNIQPFDFGAPPGAGSVQPFDFGAPAGGPPAPSPGGFEMDQAGLPSWLQTGAAPAPPAPAGGLGNVQPFEFGTPPGSGGNVQPFDFGAMSGAPSPPPTDNLGAVQPFDFGNMDSFDMGGGLGSPAPAAQPGRPGNVQPFDFGNLQPFDFGAPAPPPAATPADLDNIDDFVDFLNATDVSGAPPPQTAGGVQPFSFDNLDLGGPDLGLPGGVQPFSFDNFNPGGPVPAVPPPPSPTVPMSPPPTNVQPFSPEEFEFQPFSFGQEPGSGGLGLPSDVLGMEGLPDIQPFSFEGLNLGTPGTIPSGAGAFGRRAGDHDDTDYDEPTDRSGGFSWQPNRSTPAPRPAPEEEAEAATESIFAKARRRKEELEAAMRRAAAAAAPPPAPPAHEEVEVEATDIWPALEDEEGLAAAAAAVPVPAMPSIPETPAETFDFTTLDTIPTTPEAESAPEFSMDTVSPFDFTAIETPPPPAPFDFASLDVPPEVPAAPPVETPAPLGAFPDLTPGQPERLWSTPVTPAESAAEVPAGGEDFDFGGLPQLDLASLGLSPEEQAYLQAGADLELEGAAAEVPGTPAVPEGLPSWLTGPTAAPAAAEAITPAAAVPAEPAFVEEFAPTPAPAEPALAEVFSGDETVVWPEPMEPMPEPALEPVAEMMTGAEPAAPAGPTPRRTTGTGPLLPIFELEPAVAAPAEPSAPPLPAWTVERDTVPAPVVATPPPAAVPVGQAESLEDLLRHLQDNPTDAAARLVLAGVYEERDDYRRAMDEYRLLIKGRQVPANVLQIVIGNLQDLTGTLPDDTMAHRLLGDAYRKAGMYQAAISQYHWLLSQSMK